MRASDRLQGDEMPLRSLDHLRYLIEDELPRQARAARTKVNVWQTKHLGRKQNDPAVMFDEVYAGMIVRAMTEAEYPGDPDELQAKKEVWPPRFRLRH
jgi:hypothetical protein